MNWLGAIESLQKCYRSVFLTQVLSYLKFNNINTSLNMWVSINHFYYTEFINIYAGITQHTYINYLHHAMQAQVTV